MKKKILFTTLLVVATLFLNSVKNHAHACKLCKERSYKISNLVGTPLDYSQKSNWMYLDTNPKHEVDLFYIYPTVAIESQGKLASLNKAEKELVQSLYNMSASAFSSYTNVYAPYYRQIAFDKAIAIGVGLSYENYLKTSEVRTDIYSALDTYFTKYNNGRPFIFAGHSQGSYIIKMILSDYMKAHPEYLKRMVVAYAIGCSCTKEWFKDNKQVKFAEGETDTGVVVSWNTEGPNPTMKNSVLSPGARVINPINWKLDETPATIEENKGTLNRKTLKIEQGSADATIDLKRGSVVCSSKKDYISKDDYNGLFGDKSFHMNDYDFYYANIKENGLKRIEAYLGHKVKY